MRNSHWSKPLGDPLLPEYTSNLHTSLPVLVRVFHTRPQAGGTSIPWTTFYKGTFSAYSEYTEAEIQEAGPCDRCFSKLSRNPDAR